MLINKEAVFQQHALLSEISLSRGQIICNGGSKQDGELSINIHQLSHPKSLERQNNQ